MSFDLQSSRPGKIESQASGVEMQDASRQGCFECTHALYFPFFACSLFQLRMHTRTNFEVSLMSWSFEFSPEQPADDCEPARSVCTSVPADHLKNKLHRSCFM